ncbi:MAG TPA: methyltransferase domain-containing protein [Solirubrobacteraceae bacterium]|jgi:ubiquinone/menaquinone biosynthesis C-methylase UbiE
MTNDTHAQRVHKAFSHQASAFENAHHNHVFTTDASWLFEDLRCGPQDTLLDVAAGTGHAARQLASRVRFAIALDVTDAMLKAGKAAAEQQDIENLVFMRGDALALPFLDESFDVVLSRFATHHIQRPDLQLAEMERCLRHGGQLALADMVADDDEQLAASQNRLERLRDPSHAGMLSVSWLAASMEGLGLEQIAVQSRIIDRPVEPWLQQSAASADVAEAIRAELREEIAGGPKTGFAPREADGELRFAQAWACVTAVKTAR